jgi:hypothetical protein
MGCDIPRSRQTTACEATCPAGNTRRWHARSCGPAMPAMPATRAAGQPVATARNRRRADRNPSCKSCGPRTPASAIWFPSTLWRTRGVELTVARRSRRNRRWDRRGLRAARPCQMRGSPIAGARTGRQRIVPIRRQQIVEVRRNGLQEARRDAEFGTRPALSVIRGSRSRMASGGRGPLPSWRICILF